MIKQTDMVACSGCTVTYYQRIRKKEISKASKIITRFIDQPSREIPEGEWNKKHQTFKI